MGELISKGPFGEQIVFTPQISGKYFSKSQTLFFIDECLKGHLAIRSLESKYQIIFLKAGERTKSLSVLQKTLLEVQGLTEKLKPPFTFVAIGGGSIGDFCGFLASVYHRGVRLVHCPSTWLAAIDSAHGAKNALNVNQIKNQIGSFYPAAQIIIAQSLFTKMPIESAMGEILKTILLAPQSSSLRKVLNNKKTLDANWLWGHLVQFIEIKNALVKKDPYEKNGERFKLNLGHTLGHAVESLARYSHSDSVLWGLIFSIRWSVERNWSNPKLLEQIYNLLYHHGFEFNKMPRFTEAQYRVALLKDKKRKSEEISFVFYKNNKAFIETVKITTILKQLRKQGFVLP